MTLGEYLAALANKLNGIKPTAPGMTQAEREEFDALVARVDALEARNPLMGEISGLPAIEP